VLDTRARALAGRAVSRRARLSPSSAGGGRRVRAWPESCNPPVGPCGPAWFQDNELRIEHDQGDVEIVVYNRAILGTVLDIDAGDGA
jgi:hypothetical protein